MDIQRDTILEAALRLDESDRMMLVTRLLETLPDDMPGGSADEPVLEEELKRRSGDTVGAVPWEQLRDELRSGG